MKKSLRIIGMFLYLILFCIICVYIFVLQYPNLKDNPTIGKWYRVETNNMISSDGSKYYGLFKKGSENNVMVYFAGGGLSINEQTANSSLYTKKLSSPDTRINRNMIDEGIASDYDDNLFKDWTIILIPYTTGDFHCGMGKFAYTDENGKEKILYHNGYINFTELMDKIIECSGICNPDKVLVTGYSAGGFGAALLADDIFSNYFNNAKSKTLFVDSGMMICENWYDIAKEIWEYPEHIQNRITSNNITLDMLIKLHEKYKDDVTILYSSSVRDGTLAQIQSYLKNGIINETTGKIPVKEEDVDEYQAELKQFVLNAKEKSGTYFFIFDDYPDYIEHKNMTIHTIITSKMSFKELNGTGSSISKWLWDAINENPKDYGINLLDKKY